MADPNVWTVNLLHARSNSVNDVGKAAGSNDAIWLFRRLSFCNKCNAFSSVALMVVSKLL